MMDTSAPVPRQEQHNEARKRLLALDPALGAVYLCGNCRHVHFSLDNLHFKTDPRGFQSLVVLLNRAAANYELWIDEEGNPR